MTNLSIEPGLLKTSVQVPGSKSYANRILILAALKKTPLTIRNLPRATDVTWLLSALTQIGVEIEFLENQVTVTNSFPECEKETSLIKVGEGGTTARFLASLLLLGSKKHTLVLGERLKERPWIEFIEFVQSYGGLAQLENNHLHLQGPLQLPREVSIDCSRTTQFASGINLVFHNQTKVYPAHLKSSQSYLAMTEALIEMSGKIQQFNVPLDWSSASYPLVFAALKQKIFFPKLTYDPFQSDAKILDVLRSFNVVEESIAGLTVAPVLHHHEIEMDVSDCLDLVPALAFFLAHIKGKHRLLGITNLIHKESNRLQEIINLLTLFERRAWSEAGTLFIEGNELKSKASPELQMVDDHRMIMAAGLFLRAHSGGVLGPLEAVSKSYPGFFELFV